MSVTQTREVSLPVKIPASHRLVIDIPREVPAGPVVLTFTPPEPPRESGGKIHLTGSMVDEMMRDEALLSLTGILHTDMPLEEIRAERLRPV